MSQGIRKLGNCTSIFQPFFNNINLILLPRNINNFHQFILPPSSLISVLCSTFRFSCLWWLYIKNKENLASSLILQQSSMPWLFTVQLSSIVNEAIKTISVFWENAKQTILTLLEVSLREGLLPLLLLFACFCFVGWFWLDLRFCAFKIFSQKN